MLETEAGVCRAEHLAEASHMRNTTLQISSFQMEKKHLRKMDFTSSAQDLAQGEANAAGGSAF